MKKRGKNSTNNKSVVDNIEFELEERYVDAAIRNEHTNGKFVKVKDYNKFIRKNKLNKINDTEDN